MHEEQGVNFAGFGIIVANKDFFSALLKFHLEDVWLLFAQVYFCASVAALDFEREFFCSAGCQDCGQRFFLRQEPIEQILCLIVRPE